MPFLINIYIRIYAHVTRMPTHVHRNTCYVRLGIHKISEHIQISMYRLAYIDDHNHYIIYAQLLVHKAALRHQSSSAGCPLHSGKKSILFKL